METQKISFDYDDTLSEGWVQTIASLLVNVCEVWIVTSRTKGNHNPDLDKIAKRIGILPERIVFTDGAMKWSELKRLGIHIHFDNMEDEIIEINNNTTCKGVLIGLKDLGELWYLFHNEIENKK